MKGEMIDKWGADRVEALAGLAIDLLCEPPVEIDTFSTRIPARQIDRGREVMEGAGIDWRKLKSGPNSERYERSRAAQ